MTNPALLLFSLSPRVGRFIDRNGAPQARDGHHHQPRPRNYRGISLHPVAASFSLAQYNNRRNLRFVIDFFFKKPVRRALIPPTPFKKPFNSAVLRKCVYNSRRVYIHGLSLARARGKNATRYLRPPHTLTRAPEFPDRMTRAGNVARAPVMFG